MENATRTHVVLEALFLYSLLSMLPAVKFKVWEKAFKNSIHISLSKEKNSFTTQIKLPNDFLSR